MSQYVHKKNPPAVEGSGRGQGSPALGLGRKLAERKKRPEPEGRKRKSKQNAPSAPLLFQFFQLIPQGLSNNDRTDTLEADQSASFVPEKQILGRMAGAKFEGGFWAGQKRFPFCAIPVELDLDG